MQFELSPDGEQAMELELAALRERTEAMRRQAVGALSHARDAMSLASELQRRSGRARERAFGRASRRHARQLELNAPRETNVLAFDVSGARRRLADAAQPDASIDPATTGLDRAA